MYANPHLVINMVCLALSGNPKRVRVKIDLNKYFETFVMKVYVHILSILYPVVSFTMTYDDPVMVLSPGLLIQTPIREEILIL